MLDINKIQDKVWVEYDKNYHYLNHDSNYYDVIFINYIENKIYIKHSDEANILIYELKTEVLRDEFGRSINAKIYYTKNESELFQNIIDNRTSIIKILKKLPINQNTYDILIKINNILTN